MEFNLSLSKIFKKELNDLYSNEESGIYIDNMINNMMMAINDKNMKNVERYLVQLGTVN